MWISSLPMTARPATEPWVIGSSPVIKNGIDPLWIIRRRMSPSAQFESTRRPHYTAGPRYPRWCPAPAGTSVGELAMTPKISLVAVCCSKDSLSSLNSRTFSSAMTA